MGRLLFILIISFFFLPSLFKAFKLTFFTYYYYYFETFYESVRYNLY